MTLSPQAIYVQECILKAVHHTDDIEEAIQKELLLNWWRNYQYIEENNWIKHFCIWTELLWSIFTLDKILYTLWDRYIYKEWFLRAMILYSKPVNWEKAYFVEIPRNLLNKDWTSCTLFDQSEETISSIANILWYKNK